MQYTSKCASIHRTQYGNWHANWVVSFLFTAVCTALDCKTHTHSNDPHVEGLTWVLLPGSVIDSPYKPNPLVVATPTLTLMGSLNPQVHTAVQQPGFKRVKRGLRPAVPAIHGMKFDLKMGEANRIEEEPTDPYFPMQWYLKNTGQNGGKVRLDLNVQAAWAQGITGKNVTTAIMDDGGYFRKRKMYESNLQFY